MLQRVVTGVLAAAVALAAILWREPWGLVALLAVAAVVLTLELSRLLGCHPLTSAPAVVFVLGALTARSNPAENTLVFAGACWIATIVGLVIWSPNSMARFCLYFWIGGAVLVAAVLGFEPARATGPWSFSLLLLALVPLWVGDSLAYFVGKWLGRTKLAPAISPNKTWEGAAANLAASMAAAWGIGAWLRVPLPASLAVGASTGVLGQVGDLLQSRLKRRAGVKDSGSLLPGHGGLLDRLDSFLFSAYPSLLALYLLAPGMFHVKRWPW